MRGFGITLEIAAIVTGHQEGEWLKSSIGSAIENVRLIHKSSGDHARVYIFLDRPDLITEKVASEFYGRASVVKVNFGDISKVRNFAVNYVEEDYIAFLDGDDLWSNNWLFGCRNFLNRVAEPRSAVLHPEINYQFGGQSAESMVVLEQVSSTDSRFSIFALATGNYWSALCMAHREIFLSIPYRTSNYELGFGFEDWTFNIETMANKFEHLIVPQTAHFIRRKLHGSRVKHEISLNINHFPSQLWANQV
jgi:glycosyltransferase involved in cell wall biosynthesis